MLLNYGFNLSFDLPFDKQLNRPTADSLRQLAASFAYPLELELELIQSHMTQKPMLRGEVDARALRV